MKFYLINNFKEPIEVFLLTVIFLSAFLTQQQQRGFHLWRFLSIFNTFYSMTMYTICFSHQVVSHIWYKIIHNCLLYNISNKVFPGKLITGRNFKEYTHFKPQLNATAYYYALFISDTAIEWHSRMFDIYCLMFSNYGCKYSWKLPFMISYNVWMY